MIGDVDDINDCIIKDVVKNLSVTIDSSDLYPNNKSNY